MHMQIVVVQHLQHEQHLQTDETVLKDENKIVMKRSFKTHASVIHLQQSPMHLHILTSLFFS